MNARRRSISIATYGLALASLSAAPSTLAQDNEAAGALSISPKAGFATGSSQTGVTLGGSILYDVAPRLSVEVSGAYFDRAGAASGASGLASLLVNLRPAREKAVPYLAVGGGIYHASFGGPGGRTYHAIFEGPGGGDAPRSLRWPGRAWGEADPTWGVPGDRGSETSGAVTVGGGLRIDVGDRVFVRPDARALVVLGDETRTLGVFTLDVGYRF